MNKPFIYVLIGVFVALIAGGAYWLGVSRSGMDDEQIVHNFQECVNAGYPVAESYPRQCFGPDGVTFVEPLQLPPVTTSYTSPKGVEIVLQNFSSDQPIRSPFHLDGQVPGSWSFEADFPVELRDSLGNIIVQAPATLQGDWMTEDLVPFSVTLTFESPDQLRDATLILKKDNPSGLAENDDTVEIPVMITP